MSVLDDIETVFLLSIGVFKMLLELLVFSVILGNGSLLVSLDDFRDPIGKLESVVLSIRKMF